MRRVRDTDLYASAHRGAVPPGGTTVRQWLWMAVWAMACGAVAANPLEWVPRLVGPWVQ